MGERRRVIMVEDRVVKRINKTAMKTESEFFYLAPVEIFYNRIDMRTFRIFGDSISVTELRKSRR